MDNFTFKLCYRWTVLLLVVFSIIVTCRLFLGNSFTCMPQTNTLPPNYVNEKCYTDGTYNKISNLITEKEGSPSIKSSAWNDRRYHAYYPWVNLLFLVHAFNFYLPHLLWESYESGYMIKRTAGPRRFLDDKAQDYYIDELAKYVISNLGFHRVYTSLYIFLEACNFVISVGQIVWLVYFFDVTGTPDSIDIKLDTWSDFRHFYFPPTGMCELKQSSKSGELISDTVLCELSLNRLYMIMFLFLQAWYIFIAVLTGLNLLYDIAYFLLARFRYIAAVCTSPRVDRSVLRALCHGMSNADLFFLFGMRKAMIDVNFDHLLYTIHKKSLRLRNDLMEEQDDGV